VAEPYCSIWRNNRGELGIRVAPLGDVWTWVSPKQARALLKELEMALKRLKDETRRGVQDG
jgi:hypothetical protein